MVTLLPITLPAPIVLPAPITASGATVAVSSIAGGGGEKLSEPEKAPEDMSRGSPIQAAPPVSKPGALRLTNRVDLTETVVPSGKDPVIVSAKSANW